MTTEKRKEGKKSKILITWHEMIKGNSLDSYSNYGGDTDHAHMYMPISYNRDSNLLTIHNYNEFLKQIEEKWEEIADKYKDVYIDDFTGEEFHPYRTLSFDHWACGWYEGLFINPMVDELVKLSEELFLYLHEEYPVLNEDKYFEKKYEEQCRIWDEMSISERIYYCNKARLSIFSARHSFSEIEDNWRIGEYMEI